MAGVPWLAREQVREPGDLDALESVGELFTAEALETAITAQIDRSRSSATLKDPTESQTLSTRLTALRTIAPHGLRNDEIVAQIDPKRFVYADYIVTPRDLRKEAAQICTRPRKAPNPAVAFVNAPGRLADRACEELAAARENRDEPAEEKALRRFASAALFALQLSRPLRTRNLFTRRLHATPGCPGNIAWLSAPAAVRWLMLEDRAHLEPGAAASEPTFRTLLRALARYAPQTSTAPPWPDCWGPLSDVLARARYRASIDRCAAVVSKGLATEDVGLFLAFQLSEAFTDHPTPARRARPITAANYMDPLIAVGRKAGIAPAEDLDAMRLFTQELRAEADAQGKLKTARIHDLMSRGGFAHVIECIAAQRAMALVQPHRSAARERHMQAAALCAILANKPARRGDAAARVLGQDLTRAPCGDRSLEWTQEKTGRWTEAGVLWPEVSALLDEVILGGRPDRLVHVRHRELPGRNWLTFAESPPPRRGHGERRAGAPGTPRKRAS